MLKHVGNPFGLAAAFFGAGNFGNEERLVDVRERVVGLLEYLRECLPFGPALAFAPVVTVDGNVVDVFVTGIVARERGAFAVVRDIRGPYPFDVLDVFFAENQNYW